jgi:hypothetical protein
MDMYFASIPFETGTISNANADVDVVLKFSSVGCWCRT